MWGVGGGGELTATFAVHLLTHSLCPRPGKLASNNSMRKKDPEVQLYSRQKLAITHTFTRELRP